MKRPIPISFRTSFVLHLGVSFAFLLLAGSQLSAQTSVYVEEPAEIAGPLDFTHATAFGADLDSIAPISGYLTLADDGTEADSLGCETLVNTNMTGRIALVYRGVCNFSMKAYTAQQAGAIAVIIVNNAEGPPVGMAAGDNAELVTIPVAMISNVDGAMLRAQLDLSVEVLVRMGSLTGHFPYNLAMEDWGIMVPPAASMPAELVMNNDEFLVELGAWIMNYGSMSQDEVTLQAVITQDGNVVYDQTSLPATVGLTDTLWFALPDFEQPQYSGRYEITYTVNSPNPDAYEANNEYSTSIHIGEVFSYAPADPVTGEPVTGQYVSPSPMPAGGWRTCIFFRHPNASRVAATGMYVNTIAPVDSPYVDNFIEVQANIWNDIVETYTAMPTDDILAQEIAGNYSLTEDDRGEPIYVEFAQPIVLLDGTPYLFCLITSDDDTWHGYTSNLAYDQYMLSQNVPVSRHRSTQWFSGFADFNNDPSIGVRMVDVNTIIGIDEIEKIDLTPFPNPTADRIRIPMKDQTGLATLEIFDLAGAKVSEQRVNVTGQEHLVVELNGISNGTYVFNMMFDNGRRANFRVVLSR